MPFAIKGSFGYCKNIIEHYWSCMFLEGSSSYQPIELTIQLLKVGTNSSFLKESLLFATSHTCVRVLNKNQGGKLFCSILGHQNFKKLFSSSFDFLFNLGMHKWCKRAKRCMCT